MSPDPLSLNAIWQRAADIALYKEGLPVAVVELKVFTDSKAALSGFAEDLIKGDLVGLSLRVPVYAVAPICRTEGRDLDRQKAWIEQEVGQKLTYSQTMQTKTGEGRDWCFGVVKRGGKPIQ